MTIDFDTFAVMFLDILRRDSKDLPLFLTDSWQKNAYDAFLKHHDPTAPFDQFMNSLRKEPEKSEPIMFTFTWRF